MALHLRFPKLISRVTILCLFATLLLIAPSSKAQFSDLRVTVGDTLADSGEQNSIISIYMDNFRDEIAGFNLWIQLDRPDLIKFQTNTYTVTDNVYWKCLSWDGSTCTDSIISNPLDYDFVYEVTSEVAIGNHDTTGTLISGWEYVDSRSLGGQGNEINIAAFSNMPAPPETPGILPQQGGLLVKILADVFDIPDTLIERTVNLIIQYELVDHFNFSRTDGSSIGIAYELFTDSTCWDCEIWAGPSCLNWIKRSVMEGDYSACDSVEVKPDSTAYVDTDKVILIDGSLTVLVAPICICGDMNGDNNHLADISDLTYLVDYLFGGGPEPPIFCCADINSSGGTIIDISDLTYMIDYLFLGGSEPNCTCN